MAGTRNSNQQGSTKARKLKGGTVVWDAWAPPHIDPDTGKKVRPGKRGMASQDEAQKWIARTISDAENGVKVLSRRGAPSVNECFEGWAETTHLKPSSVAQYRKMIAYADEGFLAQPISKVLQVHFDRMVARMHRNKERGVSVMSAMAGALKHAWAYAKSAKYVSVNIIDESEWPARLKRDVNNRRAERAEEAEDSGVIPVLTPGDVKWLLDTERNRFFRVLWEFIVSTGMRRGETLALRWSDVYLDEGYIWIRVGIADDSGTVIPLDTPKGNKRRKIYIHADTVKLLRSWQAELAKVRSKHGDAWVDRNLVFPVVTGARTAKAGDWYLPGLLSEAYARRARALKLPSTKIHSLRFTWASTAYTQGVPIKVIQDHLGHRLDITTLVYVKPDSGARRDAVTRVVDHLRAS